MLGPGGPGQDRIHDSPLGDCDAAGQPVSEATASARPRPATSRTYGSSAFESALVAVSGTEAGTFFTQ